VAGGEHAGTREARTERGGVPMEQQCLRPTLPPNDEATARRRSRRGGTPAASTGRTMKALRPSGSWGLCVSMSSRVVPVKAARVSPRPLRLASQSARPGLTCARRSAPCSVSSRESLLLSEKHQGRSLRLPHPPGGWRRGRTRADSRSEDATRGRADGAGVSSPDPPADRRGNAAAAEPPWRYSRRLHYSGSAS
jgi:hypothetical protein